MAPEFPAGIVYSSIKPKRPHAIGNVVFRPPGMIGFTNDAAPIAALAIKPAKAQTLSVAAINCMRASLPCCRAMKPGTVTDRSLSSAWLIKARIGSRSLWIKYRPAPNIAEKIMAGQNSPLAPQLNNWPKVAICRE
jgi:hypothetical protein